MCIQLGRDFLNKLVIWLPETFSRTGSFQESIEHWEFGIAHPFLFTESYTSKALFTLFTKRISFVCIIHNTHQFGKNYSYWAVMPSMRSFRHLLPQTATLLTQRIAAFHNPPQIQSIGNVMCNKRLRCKGKRLAMLQKFDDAFSAVYCCRSGCTH